MVNFPPRRRRRRLPRSPTRRALRCPLRRLNRAGLRALPGHRRGPDDLAQALTACRRAIRCHRRLARLAPNFFDATVVNREECHRAERLRWRALWKPALDKVYGAEPDLSPPDPEADLPPLPSRRLQRVVQRELAGWDLWMDTAKLAFARHQQRRPHARPSLNRIARLLQIAHDFGLLACGLPTANATSEPSSFDNFLADLERAYGQHSP